MTAPLHLSGSPHARGLQQAQCRPGLADRVRHAVATRLEGLGGLAGTDVARRFLRQQQDFMARHDPEGLQETRGIAEGWGLAADTLLTYLHANVIADLGVARPAQADGCSSWAARRDDGGALVVKNRDYRGEHGQLQQVFLHDDPDAPCPRILCVGSLGSPGAFSSGMNLHGLAVVDTQIGTLDHGPGWLRYFLMTALLWRCRNVDEALALVRSVPHAGGGSLVLGDADGRVASVELAHRGGAVIDEGPGWVARTNHFLAPALAAQGLRPRDDLSDSTEGRLDQLQQALANAAPQAGLAWARALMSSHAAGGSLCRHAAPGRSGTLSCVVYDTARRTLHMSHGRPCDATWAAYTLQAGDEPVVAHPGREAP